MENQEDRTARFRKERAGGNIRWYPVNEAAKHFTAISGWKTLPERFLENIRALGFAVEVDDLTKSKSALQIAEELGLELAS